MIDLVSANILPAEYKLRALSWFSESIGYAVYFHEGIRSYVLDLYASRKPSKYPFCALLPAVDLSRPPSELSALGQYL